MKDFGSKISRLRKSKGMTQEDLGKVLNVTYQAVSKWERDESLPDLETMSRIAKFFEVPVDYFVNDDADYTSETKETPTNEIPAEAPKKYIGVCTQCGKMITEDEAYSVSPKIICLDCAERISRDNARRDDEQRTRRRERKEKEILEQCGHGVDFTLILSIILTVVSCIGMTIFCNGVEYDGDAPVYGFLLFLVPLAVFGYTHSISTAIREMKDDFDEDIGYNRNTSLITGGIIALVNLACFLTVNITTKETSFIYLMIGAVILSFTFVSQYMWGGVIQTIFTAGGFTFKLPGFIFSLDIDSILWMIVTKIFLGILAALVMLITTAIVITVAVVVSVFTFIPSVLSKSVKDAKVRKED